MMSESDKKIMQSFYKKARSSWPLAYYFYRTMFDNSVDHDDAGNVYHQYVENDVMDFFKIRATLEAIDKAESQTRQYLYWKYNILRKIGKVSFGLEDKQIPNVKFTSNKSKITRNHRRVTYDEMNQAYSTLQSKGKLVEALVIKLIWSYHLRPGEFALLKFKDIYQEKCQYFINIPNGKKKTFIKKRITKTLVELIYKIKNNKIKTNNYKCEFRKEFDNEYAKEYYIFGKGKNYISNLFKSDFEGEVPEFNT